MILFYFYCAIKYWFHLIQCAHFIDTLWLTLPCWSFLEVKNHSATLSWCSWKRRIIITDATGDEWLNHTSNKRGWKVFTHFKHESLRRTLRKPNISCIWWENKRDGGRQTESGRHGVVGMAILKWDDLAGGAGKRSIQNKWEVNMQPQEAINCSKDQLGPSRCSWPPALVLPHLRVCDGARPSQPGGQQWPFFICSAVWGGKGRLPGAFIAPSLPPTHQVQVIREGNYVPLKRLSFYRWGR